MRLVDSSDPDAVPGDQLLHHLLECAVLTSQVCRELHRSGGSTTIAARRSPPTY